MISQVVVPVLICVAVQSVKSTVSLSKYWFTMFEASIVYKGVSSATNPSPV